MKPFALVLAAALLAGALSAAVPQTIVYQGRLTDNGAPVTDGLYLIQFRIYDAPAAGATLWDNDYRTVLVTDGLFSYNLGDSTALPHNLFADTGRWLGMKVGANPEMSPRIPLASYAYAYHALRADTARYAFEVAGDPYVNETGDVMSGNLSFTNPDNGSTVAGVFIRHDLNSAFFSLYDADISTLTGMASLIGNQRGTLQLRDSSLSQTATLSGGHGSGGVLQLFEPGVTWSNISLWGGYTGDSAVDFPNNAINEQELLNEPGIAAQNTFQADLTSTADIVVDSATITAPTAGYLVVMGSGIFYRIHTSGSGYTALRASVGDSRSIDLDNGAIWTVASAWPSETYYSPFSVHAIIPVTSAGTTEVFLVADAHSGSGVLVRAHLTALFFPTAYGTTESVKSSGLDPRTIDGSDLPAPETYDARPLIESERAAQLEQQRLGIEAQLRETQRSEDRD